MYVRLGSFKMSNLFICGEDGCSIHVLDDDSIRIATGQTKHWAKIEKLKKGVFPRAEEQEEYFAAAYIRLTEIHIGSAPIERDSSKGFENAGPRK